MSLLSLSNAHLAFGHVALLDGADFSLLPNERVGLIGANGTGKSSFLRILAGLELPDDGLLQSQNGVNVVYVAQEADFDDDLSIREVVSLAMSDVRSLIDDYSNGRGDLDLLHSKIEAVQGWNWEQRVDEVLGKLGLDGSLLISALSGGMKKRTALARALVMRPDVLLLDEPTNHLDLDSIRWLEELLNGFEGSSVVISHDRAFLDAISTRIVELDRGNLSSYPGNFAKYQELKEIQLEQEATINARADKLLAQEEVWIRQGVEARRTRAQGRINRLKELRAARAARRDVVGKVSMDIDSNAAGYQGKLVVELNDVCFSYGDKKIVTGLTSNILRGDKVGLIGPNGAGKSTLLRLILGGLEPDAGSIRRSSNLQIAYFDQMRAALDLDATLEDFISPGSEWIEIGKKRQHVKSYLGDFLFSPARAASPVRSLSGGERNRLLLARLFARPANVLVLDEPTNDLDIQTIELLEELLQNYEGTVFLVSHDRAFLDNVVSSTLVWSGQGLWREYEGGVNDWILQSQRWQALLSAEAAGDIAGGNQQSSKSKEKEKNPTKSVNEKPTNQAIPVRKKLSYKEQRLLETLPQLIENLESEQNEIRAKLQDGTLYQTDLQNAIKLQERDAQIEEELMNALESWENLS